jgi:DNA-binding FadR family transcriptional regulator
MIGGVQATTGTAAAAPLHERVVADLTARVVSGEWPPGFLLPTEAELTALLGVSRTVVREGMRLIVDRGLVIVRQGKGTTVAPRRQWDLLDPLILSEGLRNGVAEVAEHVMEARRLLEPLIAGMAAERIIPAHLDEIEQVQRVIEQGAETPDTIADLGVHFHELLATAAGNPLVARMLMPIYAALRLWRETLRLSPDLRRASHHEHHQILAALQAGDAARASAAAALHLEHTFEARVRATVARGVAVDRPAVRSG